MFDCAAVDAEALPRTRAEAVAVGAKRYFTGKPCIHGHAAPRQAVNGMCAACIGAWARRNPAAIAAKAARHREKRRIADPKLLWATDALMNARKRAALKNVLFRLARPDLLAVAGDICPVFGVRLRYVSGGKHSPDSATLDRLVPYLGYVPGNIAVVSYRANTIKNDATPDELLAVAAWAERARAA